MMRARRTTSREHDLGATTLATLAVGLGLSLLASVSVSAQTPTEAAPAASEPAEAAPAATRTLDRIRQTGALTFGYRTDAAPFSFERDGAPTGYSIELCQAIADGAAEELGLEEVAIEWRPVAVEDRFPALQSGSIDLMCGADTATLTRREEVSFSLPIFPSGIGAILSGDEIGLRAVLGESEPTAQPIWRGNPGLVLEDKTFAVVEGTTSESWLAERLDAFRLTAHVSPVSDYDAGIQQVLSGESDVFFGDRPILLATAAQDPAARGMIVLDRLFTYEPIALSLPRDDDDFRLLVDRALSKRFRSEDFRDLYVKWFGEPSEEVLTFFRLTALPE